MIKRLTQFSAFEWSKFLFFVGVLLVAQTTWRPGALFTVSDWIFLGAVIMFLPVLFLKRRVDFPIPKSVLLGLVLVLLGGLLSSISAQWPISSVVSVLKMAYLIGIWFSVGILLMRRPEDVQGVMLLWAISAAVTSAGAAAQMIWGDIIPWTSPVWGRMTGLAEHVNDLGALTSVALVPAMYVAIQDRQNSWLSLLFWFLACLVLCGLIWSGSLSGMLAASTSLFIWILLQKGGLKHVLILILGSGALVFLVHQISTVETGEKKPLVAEIKSPPAKKVEPRVAFKKGSKSETTKPDGQVTTEKKSQESPMDTRRNPQASVGETQKNAEMRTPAPTDEAQIDAVKIPEATAVKAQTEAGKKSEVKGGVGQINGGKKPDRSAKEAQGEAEPTIATKPKSIPSEPEITKPELTKEEKAKKALLELAKNYKLKSDEPPLIVTRLLQLRDRTINFVTLQSRFQHNRKIWKSISQNVFVGVGVGYWNGRYETGRLVHNIFLGNWYEGGLLALLGIVILLGAITKIGIEVITSPERQIRLVGIPVFSSFCAFLVLGMAQPIYNKRFLWLPALLILTMSSIQTTQRGKLNSPSVE